LMKGFARFVLDSVLPRRCVSCDVLTGGAILCPDCVLRLRRAEGPSRIGGPGSPALLSPWYESEILVGVVRFLKFEGGTSAVGMLGAGMADELSAASVPLENALLVSVPLHWTRLARRGYDQALLLARDVSLRTGVPVLKGAIVRKRRTRAQSGLGEEERGGNVSGAFRARKIERLAGRDVLLVDDLVTTGETALACCGALSEAGPASVTVLSAGRKKRGNL